MNRSNLWLWWDEDLRGQLGYRCEGDFLSVLLTCWGGMESYKMELGSVYRGC